MILCIVLLNNNLTSVTAHLPSLKRHIKCLSNCQGNGLCLKKKQF